MTQSKHVMLVNQFAWIGFCLCWPFIGFFFYIHLAKIGWLALGINFIYLIVLCLNYVKRYSLAKFLLIGVPLLGILVVSYVFGNVAYFHLFSFTALAIIPLVFSISEALFSYITATWVIGIFLCIEFLPYFNHAIFDIPSFHLQLLQFGCCVMSMALTIYFIRIYINKTVALEDELIKTNRTQEGLIIKLKLLTSYIAHELKNPLAMLQGGAKLAYKHFDDKQRAKQYAEIVQYRTDQLSQLVTMFLTHQDVMATEKQVICLTEMIDKLRGLCDAVVMSRHILLQVEGAQNVSVYADPKTLFHALMNVLVNAIEAVGSQGKIWIIVSQTDHVTRIEIKDSGDGFEKKKNRIWDKGEDAQTGFGLSFVQKVIDQHGGNFLVSFSADQGTTVVISLPNDRVL